MKCLFPSLWIIPLFSCSDGSNSYIFNEYDNPVVKEIHISQSKDKGIDNFSWKSPVGWNKKEDGEFIPCFEINGFLKKEGDIIFFAEKGNPKSFSPLLSFSKKGIGISFPLYRDEGVYVQLNKIISHLHEDIYVYRIKNMEMNCGLLISELVLFVKQDHGIVCTYFESNNPFKGKKYILHPKGDTSLLQYQEGEIKHDY